MLATKFSRVSLAAGLFAAFGVTGCKWTDFDDVAATTWVSSVETPSIANESSDWGNFVTAAGPNQFAVVGRNKASFVVMTLGADGSVSSPGADRKRAPADTITHVGASPTGSAAAYVAGSVVVVWDGNQFFDASAAAPADTKAVSVGTIGGAQHVFVASPSALIAYTPAGATAKTCSIPNTIAMTAVEGDQVAVWTVSSGTGQVTLHDMNKPDCGKVSNGAVAMAPAAATGRLVASGRRVYGAALPEVVDATLFAVEFQANGNPTAGAVRTLANARTLDVVRATSGDLVVAGMPTAVVEGEANAGEVRVFTVDATMTLVDGTTLFDASPYADQAYGRAVGGTTLNGKPVVVVAAQNEVFLHFRTALFADSRAGK